MTTEIKKATKTAVKKTPSKTVEKKVSTKKSTSASVKPANAKKTVGASSASSKAIVKKENKVACSVKKTTVRAQKISAKTDLAAFIAKVLDDGKAANILSINLSGKTSLTDHLIIASGTSTRHVMALATTLVEKLKDEKIKPKMDGRQGSGEWIVIDVGEAIVHIFVPEARSFYEIETLWGEKTPIA